MKLYTPNEFSGKLTSIEIGPLTVWFSYSTVVAYQVGYDLVVSENVWSTTTGRHLNYLEDDKTKRIPRAEFVKRFAAIEAKCDKLKFKPSK